MPADIKNTDIFNKNFDLFTACNPRLTPKDYDLEHAKKLANISSYDSDRRAWLESSSKVAKLPQYNIRNAEYAESLKKQIEPFRICGDINQYIDVHVDIHLFDLLLRLRDHIGLTSIDPEDDVSVAVRDIPMLVAVGTGNGEFLSELITKTTPKTLIIAVPHWDLFISSFWHIDWRDLWLKYHSDDSRKLVISRTKTESDLINACLPSGLVCLHHAYTYQAPYLSDRSEDWPDASVLSSTTVTNAINYLGYTVDEYNMIINTSRMLAKSPRLYREPSHRLDRDIIVCGSGPSLDAAIDSIRELADTSYIFASGSNLRTLLKHGIKPKLLVLLEREKLVYDDFLRLHHEYDISDIHLFVSTTCWDSLTDIFKNVMAFFRPALTPLTVFSDSSKSVLDCEGPESINAAFSLAAKLTSGNVYLFGADLGAKDADYSRSLDALGYTDRNWDRQVEGNYGGLVHTNRMMLDVCYVLETSIKYYNETVKVYNCSDGIKINGTIPVHPKELPKSTSTELPNNFNNWWSSHVLYTVDKRNSSWNSRKPREHTFNLARQLETIIANPSRDNLDKICKDCAEALDLSVNLPLQFPRRILRSTVIKGLLAIWQQHQILRKVSYQEQNMYLAASFESITQAIQQIEVEIYHLCDAVDSIHLRSTEHST